jgi:TPR repeat protein
MSANKIDIREALIEQAELAALSGNIPKVISLYQELLDLGLLVVSARIGEFYELGFREGEHVFERDWDEATKWYSRAIAETDDPLAHLGLGRMFYYGGKNVEKDIARARSHFIKAYQGEFLDAGIYLGYMSMHGIGVERNIDEAKKYLTAAAVGGVPVGFRYLAYVAACSGRFLQMIVLAFKGLSMYVQQKYRDRNELKGLTAKLAGSKQE